MSRSVRRIEGEELTAAAARLGWQLEDGKLVKVVRWANFVEALAYVNEVGAVAEEVGHHPDIELRWDTVTLRLETHVANAITNYDLELAEHIDALPGPPAA